MARGGGSDSRGIVLLLITSGFFITGLLFDYMPMIIDDHIKRTIELATNEEILGYWSRPPVDVHSYYWLYAIKNPDQFQLEGEKPQMSQVGPFHFTSRLEKRIASLSPNKFRITYNSTRFMRLNESYSADQLDAPITVLNPIYTSILEGVRLSGRQLDAQSRNIAYGTINKLTERHNESILVRNVSARVVLLGRAMPIVDKLKKIASTFGLESQLPDVGVGPSAKYGYVSLTNGTIQGPFEIYTGYQETARSLGELISYKGKRRLSYYDGKCNRLQSSVGELRPMPLEPEKRLEMFQPSFCRIVHLDPTGELKLREGAAVSYVVSPDDFSSGTTNADNRCFCVNSSGPTSPALPNSPLDDNHCSLEGVIDLGPCSYNAPLMVSLSSVQLDSRIINSLASDFDPELMSGELSDIDVPNERAQIVILKRVGVPIRADITMTLFMRVARDPAFKEVATVPEVTYVPLLTVRETVSIPPKLAQIIINLESFLSLTYHIKVVMYLSAIILLCWLSGHYYSQTSTAAAAVMPANPAGGGGGDATASATGPKDRRSSPPASNSGGGPEGSGNEQAVGGRGGTQNDDFYAGQGRRASGQLRGSNLASVDLSASDGDNKSSPPNGPAAAAASTRGRGAPAAPAQRRLKTLEEVSARSSAGATCDSLSSERANSADSNRSLPPSRHASRLGSLSQASSEPEASESGANNKLQPGDDLDGREQRDIKSPPPPLPMRAKIFSKVDEEWAAMQRNGGGGGVASRASIAPLAQTIVPVNAAGALGEQPSVRPTSPPPPPAAGSGPLKEGAAADAEAAASEESDLSPPGAKTAGTHASTMSSLLASKKRKANWLMNVYSNFVHMLNGLRNSINDAAQLEIENENDYRRDRQLEMLAGKIDNWYSGRDTSVSPSEPPRQLNDGGDDDDDTGTGGASAGQQMAATPNQPEGEVQVVDGAAGAAASEVGPAVDGEEGVPLSAPAAGGLRRPRRSATDAGANGEKEDASEEAAGRAIDNDAQVDSATFAAAPLLSQSSSSSGAPASAQSLLADDGAPPPTGADGPAERNGLKSTSMSGGRTRREAPSAEPNEAAATSAAADELAGLQNGGQVASSTGPADSTADTDAQQSRKEADKPSLANSSASVDSGADDGRDEDDDGRSSSWSRESRVTQVRQASGAGDESSAAKSVTASQSSGAAAAADDDKAASETQVSAARRGFMNSTRDNKDEEEELSAASKLDEIDELAEQREGTTKNSSRSSAGQSEEQQQQRQDAGGESLGSGQDDAGLDSTRNGIKNNKVDGELAAPRREAAAGDTSKHAEATSRGLLKGTQVSSGGEQKAGESGAPLAPIDGQSPPTSARQSGRALDGPPSWLGGNQEVQAQLASHANGGSEEYGASGATLVPSQAPPSYYSSGVADGSMTFHQQRQQNYVTSQQQQQQTRPRLGALVASGGPTKAAGAISAGLGANGPANSNGLNGNNILNGKIISQQRQQQQQSLAGGLAVATAAAAAAAAGGFNNQHTISVSSPLVVVAANHREDTATTTGNHHHQQQQTVQPAGA